MGVTFDDKLKWSDHISGLANQLSSAAFAVKKIVGLCGIGAARTVYFAYFHSLMTYGLLFWGTAADAGRIFILQKRAIRYLVGLKSRDTCREAFRDLEIMTMTSAYIYESILYARKNLGNTPLNSDKHDYNTR